MSRRNSFSTEVEVYGSDDKLYVCTVQVDTEHDDGVWYDSNGEGCPPSFDWDWKLEYCLDEDGVKYNVLPDCVCEDDIAEAVENHIQNIDL